MAFKQQLTPVLVAGTPVAEPKAKGKGVHIDPEFNTSFPNYGFDPRLWKPLNGRVPSAYAPLLYLWLIDKVTSVYEEEGQMIGSVLGGMPIGMAVIANESNLGITWGSVQRNMLHLEAVGLIRRLPGNGDNDKSKKRREKYKYEVLNCRKEFKNGTQSDGTIRMGNRTFTDKGDSPFHCSYCNIRFADEAACDDHFNKTHESFNIANDPELDGI